MSVIGAAATACNIQEPRLCHLPQVSGRECRQLFVFAHFVGQSGIGMNADSRRHNSRQALYKRAQVDDTERAVQSEAEQRVMGDADIESLQGLAGQRTSAPVIDSCRHHDGDLPSKAFVQQLDGIECGLGIQGIETCLQQQQVGTALHQCLGLFAVGCRHLVEVNGTQGRFVHVRRQR